MAHATPSAVLYGDGSDPSTDTERGKLTVDAITGDLTLSPDLGFTGGNLSFLAGERPVLKVRLQAAVAAFEAFTAADGSDDGARRWDIVDDPADADPKRVELNENAGTVVLSAGIQHTMKVETVRGLILAL